MLYEVITHRPRGERDPAARRGRRREAAAEGALRARRGGARDQRSVQRLQRRRRVGELREEPPAGGGARITSYNVCYTKLLRIFTEKISKSRMESFFIFY